MTTTEFKEKYPHLSHLEGNDLWNAMEDAYILEHKDDKPKIITDYLGNEVKCGMEICFIRVVDKQQFRFMGCMVGGEMIGTPEPERPDVPCWEVGKYINVEFGMNYTENINGFELTAPISMLIFGTDFNTHILAIKGVSDSETQYKEYLKNKK